MQYCDGSLGCGPVWEALNFAAMDQYRTLWERVNVVECQFSLTYSITDTEWADRPRRNHGIRYAGKNRRRHKPDNCMLNVWTGIIHLLLLMQWAKDEDPPWGEGPVLLDVITYRLRSFNI